MRVLALGAAEFSGALREAAGNIIAGIVLFPPISSGSFNPAWLFSMMNTGPYDLILIDLHGTPGAFEWRDNSGRVAITSQQIRQSKLGGAVIFCLSCYLGDDNSPMLDALLDAGASYVIGGKGKNWSGATQVFGAALLAKLFRQSMERGLPPLISLSVAKSLLRIHAAAQRLIGNQDWLKADLDALDFRAYTAKQHA